MTLTTAAYNNNKLQNMCSYSTFTFVAILLIIANKTKGIHVLTIVNMLILSYIMKI